MIYEFSVLMDNITSVGTIKLGSTRIDYSMNEEAPSRT